MGADQKYSGLLDLLAKATEAELDIEGLRDGIRKELENGDKTFGIFSDLVDSLQDIIPRERQRYNAAIKALAKTSGLSRQNIIDAADNKLGDLGKVETAMVASLAGLNDSLAAMAVRIKTIRGEVGDLRRRISDLEQEEQEVLGNMTRQEKKNRALEEAVKKVFSEVASEISDIRTRIEQHAAEQAAAPPAAPQPAAQPAPQPAPQPAARPVPPAAPPAAPPPAEETAEPPAAFEETILEPRAESGETEMIPEGDTEVVSDEETGMVSDVEIQLEMAKGMEEPPPQQDDKWMKKCPLCGGQMNFHLSESLWMCYTCGNEEPQKGTGTSERQGEPAPGPGPASAAVSADPRSLPAEPAMGPEPAPAAGPVSVAEFIPTRPPSKPAGKQQPRKKACPVCRKQMTLSEGEHAWKCPHCNYQSKEF